MLPYPLDTHTAQPQILPPPHTHTPFPRTHSDDGSNEWLDVGNVVAWAGVKNYLGFNKSAVGNLFIRPDYNPALSPGMQPHTSPAGVPLPAAYYFPYCLRSLGQWEWGAALADSFLGNTCILGTTASPYLLGECNATAPTASGAVPLTGGNAFFTPNASLGIECGKAVLSLVQAQAAGWEGGSHAAANAFTNDPSGAALLQALIRKVLGR